MKYAKPEIEIIRLNVMDVIRTSPVTDDGGENELPPDFSSVGEYDVIADR